VTEPSRFSIHPEAAKRANELAEKLLGAFGVIPVQVTARAEATFQPEIPVSHTLTPEDIHGPVISRESDRFGRETARYISDDQERWGLKGTDHAEFAKTVRTLHRQQSIREAVSETTVSALVFDWLYQAKRSQAVTPMLAYVLPKLEALVENIEIVVPIFGLHLETPIKVGNVSIETITAGTARTIVRSVLASTGQRSARPGASYREGHR
jgi:hypothetical protein